MLTSFLLLTAGFIFLIKGADFLVESSVIIAKKLKISTLIIGLTIVALGTSMPEFIINLLGALRGAGEIPLGNVVGSNIANTLMVLGAASLITPLIVKSSTVWREIPYNMLVVLMLMVLAYDQTFSQTDGVVLIVMLLGFMYYIFDIARKDKENFKSQEEIIIDEKKSMSTSIVVMLVGLVGLFLGGQWVVDGAVGIAKVFGMSEFLISATIIAIGTSLPELVTAVVAARKNDVDLIVGNVVGSNILNIIFVLATTLLINPINVPAHNFADLYMLLATTIALFVFVYIGPQKNQHLISRSEGLLLLLAYGGYISFLIQRG